MLGGAYLSGLAVLGDAVKKDNSASGLLLIMFYYCAFFSLDLFLVTLKVVRNGRLIGRVMPSFSI